MLIFSTTVATLVQQKNASEDKCVKNVLFSCKISAYLRNQASEFMVLLFIISSGARCCHHAVAVESRREQSRKIKTCRICARPLDGSITAFSICDPPLTGMCTQVCMCVFSTKDSHQGWPDQTSVIVSPDEVLPWQPE